jgi:hypothetical protein
MPPSARTRITSSVSILLSSGLVMLASLTRQWLCSYSANSYTQNAKRKNDMALHSDLLGGSNADRRLHCPGSFQATQALPKSADISSESAAEGTAMHAVMDMLMRTRMVDYNVNPPDLYDMAKENLGLMAHDRPLTQAHLDTMVYPALGALEQLEADYGGRFRVLGVEQTVAFPGVPGSFGTCDLILGSDDWVLHVDWKFGAGTPVKALYVVDGNEVPNSQLLYYTTAAINTFPKLYRNRKKLAIAIIQPRMEGLELTHAEVTRKELKWFKEDIDAAIVAAIGRDPPRERGEWCRFAPCKVNCPLWTGPVLELVALSGVEPDSPSAEATAYGEYLARAKSLVDVAAMMKKEVDEQLHGYLEAGGKVPGWRLKAKVKQRQWIDEETVATTLEDLGFEEHEIWQDKLQTFQVVDRAAKRHGVKIPDELRVAPPTNETTVCATDDPAPVVDRRLAIDQFRAALEDLRSK